jgi:protoporphyrinogen oxidase
MKHHNTIYIIGAGVSGLIAAYELEQQGYHPIIIEKTDAVGGRVKTITKNGQALDLGFQVLLSAYPLANKYLDMGGLRLQKLESGALIYSNGKSFKIGDPLRNWRLLLPTLFANVGSLGDKLKIFKLNKYLKKKSLEAIFESTETSTLDYLKNFGFSEKIIKLFFKPFFAGIFLEPNLETSSRMFEFVYKMFGAGEATIPALGIGEISAQLQRKLKKSEFIFNTEIASITNEYLVLSTGEKKPHQGVIVACEAASLISQLKNQQISWKTCVCAYFEVDQTNIPEHTIALIADEANLINNLYAYKDTNSGKIILSVTSLADSDNTEHNIIAKMQAEVRQYTGANQVNHLQSFSIPKALPDIQDLNYSDQARNTQLLDHIFLAGDYLLNGSLNAAMESGRLAAQGIMQQHKQ